MEGGLNERLLRVKRYLFTNWLRSILLMVVCFLTVMLIVSVYFRSESVTIYLALLSSSLVAFAASHNNQHNLEIQLTGRESEEVKLCNSLMENLFYRLVTLKSAYDILFNLVKEKQDKPWRGFLACFASLKSVGIVPEKLQLFEHSYFSKIEQAGYEPVSDKETPYGESSVFIDVFSIMYDSDLLLSFLTELEELSPSVKSHIFEDEGTLSIENKSFEQVETNSRFLTRAESYLERCPSLIERINSTMNALSDVSDKAFDDKALKVTPLFDYRKSLLDAGGDISVGELTAQDDKALTKLSSQSTIKLA